LNRTTSMMDPPAGWKAYSTDKLALGGVRVVDPSLKLDQRTDLVIRDGIITRLGSIPDRWTGAVIDGSGLIVCPGLFDMHVHLREPGFEHKETIESGCTAAAAGGFTGVAPMPNTNPAIDNAGLVRFVRDKAYGLPVDVHPVAAISLGRRGATLTEFSELIEAGVTMFSDDGSPLASAALMRHALEYARMYGAVICEHCEEQSLTAGGVMHEGAVSTRLGLPGWPSIGEEIAVERNIALAEFTRARLHIAHASTARSLELIRAAKDRGIQVTAEVTPHHLTLDCTILSGFDSNYKVNPPLRTRRDVELLIEGLADGTIDAIATDHAPHAPDEKEVEFISAPFGMIGLETALGVIYTRLVLPGKISLNRMIELMSSAPRRIIGQPEAAVRKGAEVNLTVFNPDEEWTVDGEHFHSKAKNTPFQGWKLKGRAVGVINRGIAWMRGV